VPINKRQDFNRGNRQHTIKASLVRCVFQRSPFEILWHLPKSVIIFFFIPDTWNACMSRCVSHVTEEHSTSSSQVNPCPGKCSFKAGNRIKPLGANRYCKGDGQAFPN